MENKKQSRREYWWGEWKAHNELARAALRRMRFGENDWKEDWKTYKAESKLANKASGIMLRCKS